ncbi:MAG: TldD/PmbA family protein [Sulfolobales archaeon]
MIDLRVVVEKLESRGVSEAEVVMWKNRRIRVSYTEQPNELLDLDTISLGIRIIINKRIGVLGIEDVSLDRIDEYIDQAISITKTSPEDPNWRHLNRSYGKTDIPGVYSKELEEVSYDKISSLIREIIQSIKKEDPDAKVSRGSLSINNVELSYTNSYMSDVVTRKENSFSIYTLVRIDTSEGTGSFSDFVIGRSLNKELDVYEFSRNITHKAREFVKAEKTETGKYTVVFENIVNAAILSAVFSPAISSENIYRGRSPLVNKVGDQVLNEKIEIVDDGTVGEYIGSREFDDEGHPTQRTVIVERGVLRNYLYDSYYANLMNTRSTGNAWRSISSSPRPSHNVLVMKSGSESLDDLIKDIGRGVYVVRVIGEWLSNPVSGYTQATITHAYEIKNGEICKALKGGTLTMNLYEGYGKNLVDIAKETRKVPRVVAPHIIISDVSIS